MSADLENARSAYAAFAAGRLDDLSQWFDPDIEWVEPPELPGARAYAGKEQVRRYLRSIHELWEEFDAIPKRLEDAADGLVAEIHIRARARGATVEDRVIHHITMRDGRAVRVVVEQSAAESG